MTAWIDVHAEQPEANEVVDVEITLTHGGTTHMRGYRLAGGGAARPLWLNALTHEPFPEGWRVVRWRRAAGNDHDPAARMPGADELPQKRA